MKFFNTTRLKSLSDNKLPQILQYAIGEIILVVLGILIAVSINNWNEDRKEKKQLLNIYTVVKQDLTNDISEIREILAYHNRLEPVFKQIMGDSLTYDDYNGFGAPSLLILGYPEISFDQRGFNLLRDFNVTHEQNQDTLVISIVDFYTERLLEIEVDDKFRARDFEDNYFFWKNTYPWWNEFITQQNFSGFASYATTGNDYKNRVATAYFLTYQVYLPELDLFLDKAEVILSDIDQKLNS